MDPDADDPAAGHYNDGNRAFLQALMARGTLTFKEAKPILAAIFTVQEGNPTEPEDIIEADFTSYIAAATNALSPFDYEIRSTTHQVSKERIYGIINSTSDPITQLATLRSPDEISYIKRVLDEIFEKYNTQRNEIMAVTSMQALKVAKIPTNRHSSNSLGEDAQGANKSLSGTQAEVLLASLVEEGWFERSHAGWYTLSPRALMELRGWLVGTYNDPDEGPNEWQRIKNCEACKDIITVGQRCSLLACNVRLHDICQAAFWRTRRDKKCPGCKSEWEGGHWVGEKVVTTTEAYLQGKRRSGGGRRNEPVVEEEVEEEEEADDDDDDDDMDAA